MSDEKIPALSAADDELSVEELEEVDGGASLNGYRCTENGTQCSCPPSGGTTIEPSTQTRTQ